MNEFVRADDALPFCPLHQRLEDAGKLSVPVGNSCIACSLHERDQMLKRMELLAAEGEDSLACLNRICHAAERERALEQRIEKL